MITGFVNKDKDKIVNKCFINIYTCIIIPQYFSIIHILSEISYHFFNSVFFEYVNEFVFMVIMF